MNGVGYPLRALLGLRERELERARSRIAEAIAVERTLLASRAALAAEVDAAGARLSARSAAPPGAARAGTLQGEVRHRDRLRQAFACAAATLAAADEALLRGRAEVARLHAELAAAERGREVVARHRAGWARAREVVRARAEEVAQEEASAARGAA